MGVTTKILCLTMLLGISLSSKQHLHSILFLVNVVQQQQQQQQPPGNIVTFTQQFGLNL